MKKWKWKLYLICSTTVRLENVILVVLRRYLNNHLGSIKMVLRRENGKQATFT